MAFRILANHKLKKSQVISATEQNGAFVDQPVEGVSNAGNLSLDSHGSFLGTGIQPTLKVTIRGTPGGIGTAQFSYSPDGGTTHFGANGDIVFSYQEVVVEGI